MAKFNPSKQEGEQSAFNEGITQMFRIHDLHSRINMWNTSLMNVQANTGRYFYELKFNDLNSLFTEVSSKCSDTEMKEGMRKRKIVKDFLKTFQVIDLVKERKNGQMVTKSVINREHWDNLEELLFNYELTIRKFLEAHNMTSPKGENAFKAAFR